MPSLPASRVALLAGLIACAPLHAQTNAGAVVGTAATPFHGEPGGKRLATVERGTRVSLGAAQGEWQAVTLEGYIWNRSVGPAGAAGFDLRVTASGQENLRDAPNGTVIARLLEGFLLERVDEGEQWTQVRRSGWVRRSGVEAIPVATHGDAEAPAESPAGEFVRAPAGASLLARPEGDTTATLGDSVRVRVLSRREGWVRVRVDGWLRDADLGVTEDAPSGVTAADLRSEPDAYRGLVVRWPLMFIGVRRADELRPDMPLGQPYLLARGPLPEGEFVYVMIPEDRLAEAASLVPLSTVVVTGRIHAPRARYLGNPVLELVDLQTGRGR